MSKAKKLKEPDPSEPSVSDIAWTIAMQSLANGREALAFAAMKLRKQGTPSMLPMANKLAAFVVELWNLMPNVDMQHLANTATLEVLKGERSQ